MRRWQFLIIVAALFLNSQISAETQADPTGVWLTQAGGAKIKISKCGAGLCGTIIWLKTPIDASSGKPQVDDRNANRAQANRPIIGINIFSGMKPTAGNTWSGTIYNADDGKPYSSDVIIAGPHKLEVRGCVLAILCGGETWTKLGDARLATSAD